MGSVWTMKTLQAAFVAAFCCIQHTAWSAWVAGASGPAAIMAATAGNDTILISTEGSAWLAHDRYAAGDPGFVSRLDFDSSIAGEQRIPNNGTGSVALFAGTGEDTLTVSDGFLINPNNRLEIESDTIRLGGEPGGNRPIITYDGFQHVSLSPQSPFNGGVLFSSTNTGTNYRISGTRNQIYRIGRLEVGSLDSIQGSISISNGGIVIIEDGKDLSDNIYTVDGFNRITRTGSAPLNLFLTEEILMFSGDGNNQFLIRGNSTEDFEIYAGDGTAQITFGTPEGDLDDIREPVRLTNFGGSDTLTFNDNNTEAAHTYTVLPGTLVRDFTMIYVGFFSVTTFLNCSSYNDNIWVEPGTRLHVNAGTGNALDVMHFSLDFYPGLTTINGDTSVITDGNFSPVSFSDIDHLFVYGGKDANSIAVLPSAQYPIELDASDPTGTPPDFIKLEASGLPFIQTTHEFLVYGKKLVTFTGFETVEGPPAPPPPPPPPPPPANAVDLTGNFVAATLTPKGTTKFAITAQFDERNNGTLNAVKTLTQFFLSSDPTLSPDDLPLKSKKMKLIPAAQLRTFILKKTVPAAAGPAGKFLIAKVDSTNISGDPNSSDNVIVFGPLF